jgi:hypothetical protein
MPIANTTMFFFLFIFTFYCVPARVLLLLLLLVVFVVVLLGVCSAVNANPIARFFPVCPIAPVSSHFDDSTLLDVDAVVDCSICLPPALLANGFGLPLWLPFLPKYLGSIELVPVLILTW